MSFFGPSRIPLDKPLRTFISEYNTTDAYNEHSERVTTYLVNKMPELLDIILDPNENEIGYLAVLLASNPHINLIRAMAKNGLIFTKITKLINSRDVIPPFIVARITSALTGIVRVDPNNCFSVAPYLLNFLPYVGNHNVLSIFDVCFDPECPVTGVLTMLTPLNLATILLDEIEPSNEDNEHTRAILHISCLMVQNEALRENFLTRKSLDKYARFIDSESNLVKTEAMNFLTHALEEKTKMILFPCLEKCIHTLKMHFTVITTFIVSCFGFIIKMASLNVKPNDAGESQFFEVIMKLIAQFPNHSQLMLMVQQYVMISLNDKSLVSSVFEELLPGFIDLACFEEHTASHIMCMTLLNDVQKKFGNTKEFKEMINTSFANREFFNTKLKEYMKLLESSYGGKIVKNSTFPKDV